MKRDEDEQKPRAQRESFPRRREHISRSLTFSGNSSAEIPGDFCTEISSPKREKLARVFRWTTKMDALSLNNERAFIRLVFRALFSCGTRAKGFFFRSRTVLFFF